MSTHFPRMRGNDVEETGFFRSLPYRNFFQYPPMMPCRPGAAPMPLAAFDLNGSSDGADFAIFLSVPYCRVRCHSCTYFVERLPVLEDEEPFLDAYLAYVERQISQYAGARRFMSRRCAAVYFGGGTASLLSARQTERVLSLLKGGFDFADDAEITLEGNPHEFTTDYLGAVHEAGVTHISLGSQSFQETILRETLNSPHTAEESLASLECAMSAGFKTVNVDLLYRLPGQTFDQWQREIDVILRVLPGNITAYEYVVHSRTAAEGMIAKGKLGKQADPESAHAWYQSTRGQVTARGYEETSGHTFSRLGHRQRYSDLAYAQGAELIGLGAKAYSYVNGYQFAAPSRIEDYKRQVDAGLFPVMSSVSPPPTPRHLKERHVIFSLHRLSAVSANGFRKRFGISLFEEFAREFAFLEANGALTITPAGVELSEAGKGWRSNVLEAFYDPTFR
jgi:oxygen-independent coproporphyrinogen III oxidase